MDTLVGLAGATDGFGGGIEPLPILHTVSAFPNALHSAYAYLLALGVISISSLGGW